MKNILIKVLKIFTKAILKKYQPFVIGITGSIGKTSTKEAIATVLIGKQASLRASEKNYNNEIGVPLTVIGEQSGLSHLSSWGKIFLKACELLLIKDKKYPEILVLEMAADKIGDIKYLVNMVPCDIGVLTNIGPSHLENFLTLDKIVREKRNIITHLKRQNTAVLNYDDTVVISLKAHTKAKILTYGFNEKADVCAIELETKEESLTNPGLKFKILYKGSAVPVFLPKALGQNSIYAALAAAAVGLTCGMNLVQISERLRNYRSPKGRLNLIAGIKNTFVLDDTYNASPQSTMAALDTLLRFNLPGTARRIAVLGSMLELGSYMQEGHALVGEKVAQSDITLLITVGEQGELIAQAAKKAGMSSDRIFCFAKSEPAGRFLQDQIKAGDLILVKGSQGVRMEKIVKEVMANPEQAAELLVRQNKEWQE